MLTHQFPGVRLGGIGAYTLQAARALAGAGHEVHVFTLDLPADVWSGLTGSGVVFHEVADIAARVASGVLPGALAAATQAGGEALYRAAIGSLLCDAVRRAHALTPFDIIEAAEYESLALPLMLDPLQGRGGGGNRVPVVTHIHSGSAIRRVGNALPATDDALVFEALEFAAIRAADALCAATKKVVEDTRTLVPIDRTVTTIPLPFVFDETLEPPLVDASGPILYVGRLEALKGVKVLTEALRIFLPRNLAAEVVLAGPDTNTAAGDRSMADWMRGHLGPLAERVKFLGEQNRAELDQHLMAASFVVVPSLFDNFPYVVCEALAAGRGVLVSDHIGATELAGDAGVTFSRGVAAALAAALERLHRDPVGIMTLAKKARQRALAVLSSKVTVPARIGFYERAIADVAACAPRPFHESLAGIPTTTLASLLPTILRMTSVLAGVPAPSVVTPGSRMLAIAERAGGGKGVAIHLYGAGRHTARLMTERHVWESRGHKVVGLIDDHPRFRESPTLLGLPVRSLAAFIADPPRNDAIVLLSTDTFEQQFWQQTAAVRELGIQVFKLYS